MSALVRRMVPVIAVSGLAAFFVPAGAHAAPAQSTPVMVVLDASGSMTAADAPGPRITAAKNAVTGLVGSLPSDAQVGLEVYGTSTGSSNADKSAGCKDIKVLVPVGPVDRTSFDSKVSAIKASGYTPIGQSLRTAAANLPKEGPRSIVLVSDGEDTCAPPQPCAVAKELKKQGVDLVVHTVGFKVNAAARAQLTCIAKVTGGSYRDAPDGPSLSSQLNHQVQRALRPYQPGGTPISGADSAAGAPQLHPGQYRDTYERGGDASLRAGTTKYYTVQLHRGETPYISATLVPAPTRTSGFILQTLVTLTDLQDDGCSFDGSSAGLGLRSTYIVPTAIVAPGEVGGASWPHACPTDGTFVIKVSRRGAAYEKQPLTMELALRLEPPADASGLPGPAKPQGNVRTSASGTPNDLAMGSSYNDAPLVRPGTYRDTIVSGETRFVKVHLDWGQRLAYLLTPAKLPGVGVSDGVAAYTRIASPVRAEATQPYTAQDSDAFLGGTDSTMFGSTTVPVRYTNRDSKDPNLHPYAIDGDYYVSVTAGFTTSGQKSITVPYTLVLSVVGQAERGPKYQLQRPASSRSGAPSAPASAAGVSAKASPAASSGGVSTPVVVGGTAAGVLACGVLAAVFLRRRRSGGASTDTAVPPNEW